MKPGGLCSPSDGSNMPSGDAVGAVPAHRPSDSCSQFPKASTASRDSHACLTPDLYEHSHVIRPTSSHLNGLLSYSGLSNGMYESPYTSNKGFSVPRHILSPPQSEDGEDEGPGSCTTSRGTVSRDCSSDLLCLQASDTATASTSSHLASPTYSLPNVCGKGFEQLTVVTSAQEKKPADSLDCKTSGDASCFPFKGSSLFNPKAAPSRSGSGTFSKSGGALASPKSSKRPRGRRRISLEEMVAKLHNRTEANRSGINVLQNFSTQSTVHPRVTQEKSVDFMHKDISCLSTENNSVMKSSYQSGQSLPYVCDNNNTATIYDAHLSKDSSIKDIDIKSDSGDICCGEGSSSGLPDRTPESTVTKFMKESSESQIVLSGNMPVILPNVSSIKENVMDSACNILEPHISKCLSPEDVGANIITSVTGNLQKKHDTNHDVIRTGRTGGSLGTCTGMSKESQIENVLSLHSSQDRCISKDLQSESDDQCNLGSQSIQCNVLSKLKQLKEMCSEIPVQTAAEVTSEDSVIDLTAEHEGVRSNSVELLESASVTSRDYESDIEVLFEKGVSFKKNNGLNEREPRTSSSSSAVKEFERPTENWGEGDNVYSIKGTMMCSDSVQELHLSKVDDEVSVPASLVNTDCESVQYLEPISDDENSLLCAPSLSSGLSSVSGFQSNSDTPMFSDTPSDASRGTLMVRISDAVAAILSDVSDGSLPTSPLESNSNSVDGFRTFLPKEKLSEKIDSICERLQRECTKDSNLYPLELGNCDRPQSDVLSENFKVFHSDLGKERTAFQIGISNKSQPSKHADIDIVHPEVGFAQIQKQADLGLNLSALSSLTEPAKDISSESHVSSKSNYELHSSVIPGEPVSKTQGSEQQQVASEPDQHIDKLGRSDCHKEFKNSISLVPGSLCAITTSKQSSPNSALLPDTHVTLSSHTQVPIEDIGAVECSSTLNTGINLCQSHISGSQTISSQIQNCNTSQIKNKETAAGLLKIPSAITLDSSSKSEQSPELVTDNVLHKRISSHFEIHPDDTVAGDDSLPKPALKESLMEPLSQNESSHLLMPKLASLKDTYVSRNRKHEETIMRPYVEVNESVAKQINHIARPFQAKSGESHHTTDTCNFTVVKAHKILGSATEGISFQSSEEPDAKKMFTSLDLSVKKSTEDIHSVKETGFMAAGFPEKSSLEHIQKSSGHSIFHSSILVDYVVKDKLPPEDHLKNNPEVEDSSQKKTNHSPETNAIDLTSQKICTKDLLTSETPNEDSGITFGNIDEHGQTGSLVAHEVSSLLFLDKVDTCSSGVNLNKRKSSEEIECSGESLQQIETTKDGGSLSELTKKRDATDQSCSSTELRLENDTSCSKNHAKLPDCCTESVIDSASSEVPVSDEKSSLPESSTTEDSAVNTYPISTVVHLSKHKSIDQTSYQNPSEVEWSTNVLHSQVFTTSNSLSAYKESTSHDASSMLKNASEFSRPKTTCPPFGGALSDIIQSSHYDSPSDSDTVIQDTQKKEESCTVDEPELSHTGVDEVAPKDIRPPFEDNSKQTVVVEETNHKVAVVTAPEKHALYAGDGIHFPNQDVTEVTHQSDPGTEACYEASAGTQLGHHPTGDTLLEIRHEAPTDIEVIHCPINVAEVNQQPNAYTQVFNLMKTNTEVSHWPGNITEISHSPEFNAKICHPGTIAHTDKHSVVAFDTHIHPPAEVTADMHSATPVADVINPLTYVTEDSHLPAKVTEVSCSPTVGAIVSHPQAGVAEVCHSRAAVSAEVTYPPTEVFHFGPPLAEENEVSNSIVTATPVFHSSSPLASATEISDKPSHADEDSCIEASHSDENPPVTVNDNSHPLTAATEVGFQGAVCAEDGYSVANVANVKPSQSANTEVLHQRHSAEDRTHQIAMTELTCPHVAAASEVCHSPTRANKVNQQPIIAAEVNHVSAGALDISCRTASVNEANRQLVETSEFSQPRGAAKVTSQQNEYSNQLKVACAAGNQVPTKVKKVNQSLTDLTEDTYQPTSTIQSNCLPNTHINLSPPVSTEVGYLPSATSVNLLPATVLKGCQMLAVTREIWHQPATADYPPNVSEISHPPAASTEVTQPSTVTTKVSHLPTVAPEGNQRQNLITGSIHPAANSTHEVGHLLGVIPESLPLTNHSTELHSPPVITSGGSHPHFDTTANVTQSATSTTMQVSCPVPDITPEINHLVDGVAGKFSCQHFQVTSKGLEMPVQGTKNTEALSWISGKAPQPHEVILSNYLPVEETGETIHRPDQTIPTLNPVDDECIKSSHMQTESTIEVNHSIAESPCNVSNLPTVSTVKVNFSPLEATKDQHLAVETTSKVSHPSVKSYTDVNLPLTGYIPEDTTPMADSCIGSIHPPTEGDININNSPLEVITKMSHSPVTATIDSHPLVEPTREESHLADRHIEVNTSSFENAKISHPVSEPNKFSHKLSEDGTNVIDFPVASTEEITHLPETKSDISHKLTKSNIDVSYCANGAPVETSPDGICLTFDNTEASHPSCSEVSHFPVSNSGHHLVEVSSKVRSTQCEILCEVIQSSEVSHTPSEATVGSSQLPVEVTTERSYPSVTDSTEFINLVEAATNGSHASTEATTEVSHQSIEPTPEVSHNQDESTSEVNHSIVETKTEAAAEFTQPQNEATTEVSPLLYNFETDCKLTTGNVPASVVSLYSCVTRTAPHLDDKGQLAVFENQTVTNCTDEENPSVFGCCSVAETKDNSVCLTEDNIKDLPEIESGITRYFGTETKKIPLKLQASHSHTIDNTGQDTSSVTETFNVSDEVDVMLELAMVKEEVHQSTENSPRHREVEDTTVEVMLSVTGASPTTSDIGVGVQANTMNLLLSSSNEQMQTEVNENMNDKGKGENMELEVVGTLCPICCEQLSIPLENHLTESHICNTFIPAKTSQEYLYHMLRRIQDVIDTPETRGTCFRKNFYVCRSCHFASSDINAVRFHLNTHEDVYQVNMGYDSCKCNRREYSYPFHKWKTLIHNSSYHCYKCNFFFACEKGLYNHLLALHYVKNFCRMCKLYVPQDSIISHISSHKDEEETSSIKEDCHSQNSCIVTRSSGGNFGISWNIHDNCLNFLDGKDFRLSTCSKVLDINLDRSYLKLPLKNVVEEAVVPDEAKIDPGKDITKYMKGKKTIKVSLGDGNDEVLKNLSLSIQIELQKKVSRKGRRGQSSIARAKRENDLFDVLGISSSRSRGAPKKEAQDPPGKQNQVKMLKGKLNEENKAGTEQLELPHLTRTRSGMLQGKNIQEEKNEKPEILQTAVVIEGEWSKEHTYICCSCGAGYLNLADIMDHKWEMHPSVWCAHTMIQGQGVVPRSFCRQYQPPTSQPHRLILPSISTQEQQTGAANSDADVPEMGRKDLKTCTSCSAQFEDINVFHAHLVECGGLSLFSSMKKKNKKGYRFKRRKGQGVPNNRYGNNSHPSTPLKVKTGDRSSGLNTPLNDRFTTAAVHSSGVKRRLELAVGSIDNLELKNRLKAIITGSRSKGSGSLGLPSRRTVGMKLRKKALETRRLRKTRHSDRVKEIVKKDQEKRDERKIIGKNEKEDKSEVQETQKSEEAQITKKSGIKKGSVEIIKESKQAKGSVIKQEASKSREKHKKKASKNSAWNVEGNVEIEVSKPFTVPTSEAFDAYGVSKDVEDKSMQEEMYQEGSQVEKKLETDERINGVIEKVKKNKKKHEIVENDTKSLNKSSGIKVRLSSDKKTSSKAVKNTPVLKVTEADIKENEIMKVVGLVENKECMVHKDNVSSKLHIVEKVGTKMNQALSKNIGLIDKSRKKCKRPVKNENSKMKLIESEFGHNLPLSKDPSEIEGEKKIRYKKAKVSDNPELEVKIADSEKNESDLKKSSSFDLYSNSEADPSENQITFTSFPNDATTKIQEALNEKVNEVQETVVNQLPRVRRQMYYSSTSEESEDSDDSEPEVIRNFRIGRRCGGRMGLRNRRKPVNTRYSFRTCFSSANKDESESEESNVMAKKVDYQEKEEEEFSEELPITSKRKRKVANYENQDDYTYVPYESSSDPEDDISEKEIDDLDIIPWSVRKKRKILTRSRNKDIISKSLDDTPIQNENWSEEKLEMVKVPANTSKEVEIPLEEAPNTTSQNTTENEVIIPKRNSNKLVNTYSDNSEVKLDNGEGVNDVKMPKTKKNTKLMNTVSNKLKLKDKMEKEMKMPKRKKNAKLLNTCSDTLDIKNNEILTKVPKKKRKVLLPENLSSNNVFQEETKDNVGKFLKMKNLKEVPPEMAIASIETATEASIGTPQKQNVKFQYNVAEKIEEETEVLPEKVLKKKKRLKLQNNSYDYLQSDEIHPIVKKVQRKEKLKVQKDYSDKSQNNVQGMAMVVTKKKNVKVINSVPTMGDCSHLDTDEIVGKAEKEKKLMKSKVKSNNTLQHIQDEHFRSLSESSVIGLPSTAKRRKKVKKKNNAMDQDVCHSEMFSSHILAEDEEDNIPLSTLANLNIKMKKEKLIFNTVRSKKDKIKECGTLKHKKAFGKVKKAIPMKNRDLFIKETVAFDSESSSFEGFAPVPFKKADSDKTAIKKTKKRLGQLKSLIDINASSTASESESSDVPKPHRKPKKLSVFSDDKMGTEDIGMPDLSIFSKIKRDQENFPFHHQPSVKIQVPQEKVKARPKLKPALQENLDGAESKTKVLKSSKKRNYSFLPHTMPVLEPMNIFEHDIEMVSDHPESDSNGEGVPTPSQKLPSKTKRRQSSIEKIKDIPTRSSTQQVTESYSPPDLKAVIDDPGWEDNDISPLLMEHQMPLLKTETLKPPQQRKRRIKSSQEVILKTKPDIVLDPPPVKNVVSEVINQVKEPVTNLSQKKTVKRKRAASTSGVPSKDMQELGSSVNEVVDQPLAQLSVASKKNSENIKRKKTGNSSKEDVNELKCIDCGLKFGSVASLEDHQQDCVTIAFEMSLMEAEDHLFECPHCHLTFALKGTQRKHTTSCRMVKYKRTPNRQDSKSLKRASKNVASLHSKLTEVASSELTASVGTHCGDPVKDRICSKENVADDNRVVCASPLRDVSLPSFTNHSSKVDGSEGKLQENTKKIDHMQRVGVPLAAIGSPKTKKSSQVNGKLVNSDILDRISPVNVEDSPKCSVCGFEVMDQDLSHRHQLLKQFTHCCQQQAVLEVCVLLTHYNLGMDAVRSLISSAVVYQCSTILGLDAKQQVPFISANVSSTSATKLQEIFASPHCTWVPSVLETIAKHHQTTETVSISGTRQEALKAVSALEEILKEMSEVDSAIRKNHMLKSMRETFEAGTLN